MPDYLLDGEPQTMDVPQECWGKLLETVDRRLESDGRAVSAVRFGGVDQPSFRSETLARRPLATVGSIEITTSDASELLVETIATARRSIPVLSGSAVRLAAEFRGADPAKAARQLSELVDALRTLTVLTAAIADVLELRGPERPPLHASAVAVGVGDALRTLIDRHAAQDWAQAAECLDRDLAPAILSWHSIFDQLEDRREAA